jgi:type IV pilus assembly protein PilE
MTVCKAHAALIAKPRNILGFTLIELMIAAAIVGILAAIAFPSYSRYVVRSNRAAAQSAMMDIANRQQQYLLANRAYAATAAELGFTLPDSLSSLYNPPTITASRFLDSSCVVQTDPGTMPSYVLVLDPISTSSQAGDGSLSLSSNGVKCPAGKW